VWHALSFAKGVGIARDRELNSSRPTSIRFAQIDFDFRVLNIRAANSGMSSPLGFSSGKTFMDYC
jgi:hypothetical protein